MSETMDLAAAKAALRTDMKVRRAALHAAAPAAGVAIRDRVMGAFSLPPDHVVSGFWPMGDEIDPRPLLLACAAQGCILALPVVLGRGRPLLFRRWAPGEVLEPAGFGTSVPPATAPEVEPDLLIVPLLAFDRALYRLGYGGGYYDRTLEGLRARRRIRAIGIGYDGQEVPAVPHDHHDQRLDAIATERRLIEAG